MQNREKLLRLATFASLGVAFTLFITKFLAWFVTDSVSLLSSLMDSTMDLMVSGINFLAMRYALKPADHDHRFGHGKAEDLAALTQAVFILGLATTVGIEAFHRFAEPIELKQTTLGAVVMGFSMVLTIGLVLFQKHVYRQTKSELVHGDSVHYLTDILSNAAVLFVLLAGHFIDYPYLDPIMALLICVYILHGAWEIGKPAFDKLMDKEFPEPERQKILDIIKSHTNVIEVTDLRTRHAGQKAFIQFSFTMDGNATLNEAHDTAHQIEVCILGLYPDAEISMHQEPA